MKKKPIHFSYCKMEKEACLEILVSKRDMYINALTYSSPDVALSKSFIAAINSEINMIQFIIENIDRPKTIEDHPYFYSWINETIEFHKASTTKELDAFLSLRDLIYNNSQEKTTKIKDTH